MSYAANPNEQPNKTSTLHGQKVTSGPEAHIPKNENPGVVAADSLAAESIQEGGSFAANSDSRGVDPQKAAGLTANTEDTSAARVVDRANESSGGNDDSALNAKSKGRGPTYNTSGSSGSTGGSMGGASSGGSGASSGGSGASSGSAGGSSGITDTSNIADPIYQSETGGTVLPESVAAGPKGSNITEGGFDANGPHAKFNVEPGSKEDVGRRKLDPQLPVSGGAGGTQTGVSGDGQFDALKDASA